MVHFPYVILGGGNSAGYACKAFAEKGVGAKQVCVISNEPVLPYERPALTKAYLHPPNAKVRARLPHFHTAVGTKGELQDEKWYSAKGIEVKLSHSAVELDVENSSVQVKNLKNEEEYTITYDRLILATGVRPLFTSVFPQESILKNIFCIRNERDAAYLVSAMEKPESKRVLIIGGGYIGIECAAAFAGWDCQVTMVFPETHILSRLFTPEQSAWYEDYFSEVHGINILSCTKVNDFKGSGKVQQAIFDNGRSIDVDIVIVGIGSLLNTEVYDGQVKFAPGSVRGIQVNSYLQTSDPKVYAVGDIAAFPYKGELTRHEHVDNCRKSAVHAVNNILAKGDQKDYEYCPYFYSRLFEYTDEPVNMQFYGTKGEVDDDVNLVPFGDLSSTARNTFGSVWLDESNIVIGGLLVNATPEGFKELSEIVQSKIQLADLEIDTIVGLFKASTI